MANANNTRNTRPTGKRPPNKRQRRQKKSHLGLWTALVLTALIGAYLGVLELNRPHVHGERLIVTDYFNKIEKGQVKDARLLDEDSFAVGHYVRDDGRPSQYNVPVTKGLQSEVLLNFLYPNKVPTEVDQQVGKRVAGLAAILLPGLMIMVLFGYLILSYRRGSGLFSIRSGARKITPDESKVTFADVAGQDSAVAELREIKEFLASPERFTDVGAEIPKGVLLFGPPGNGKTMLARALAGEAGASFYSISGSDFVEVYVGVGASRVRDLFREARENAPSIIFIDEIDSIGRTRGRVGVSTSNSEQEQALNQILAEMDGFSTSDGIIVIGATNRPDILDPALLRPGRFDRSIGVEIPDEDSRLAILNVHARGKVLAPSVDLAALASRAHGMTGADLANVMNEAGLLAGRAHKTQIDQTDLMESLKRAQEAPDRQRRLSLRSRSIGRRVAPEQRVMFSDVAGQDEAVAELREIREFLIDPEKFTTVGAAIPKGVLLFGPPGCGKTMLAKALACETNAAFLSVAASEFMEVWVGEGASRVRDLFAEARSMPPAILFIDEIDAVGRARAGSLSSIASSGGERENTLNQILAEMDGFSAATGVIVMGATNQPDVLDPALLRPGRFDRMVGLKLPDEAGRLAILEVHSKGKQLGPDVDLAAIAAKAYGLTGADLAQVTNEGALLAGRAEKEAVRQEDLLAALTRVQDAPELQRRMAMRSRSVGRRGRPDEKVTFKDVAGQEEAIADLDEIREYLVNPEKFTAVGARIPKGVLLFGPPGCGKTLLARALATEAHAAFISVSGGEFSNPLIGEGAARVRDFFAEARSMPPAIVFIDEIDSIGFTRSTRGSQNGQGLHDDELTQMLAEMDGFTQSTGVIVVAATNRPDVLDPALLRPGRFDRAIALKLPDEKGRLAILEIHAEEKVLAKGVDLKAIAAKAYGLTGADLANVMNEAALLAGRADKDAIAQSDLTDSLSRVMAAPEQQRRLSMRARSVGKRYTSEDVVTFKDVAGVDDAVEELTEVREFLTDPTRFTDMGARVPRGVLLSGPPGCGKTLLARALAGEANAAFLSAAATEFVEVYVGEGSARVRDLFADARAMAPAILFIDEIDAIGGHRVNGSWGGQREVENTLNQILVELDGFEGRQAVIVMAATNRPDMLDRALVRPGRFDRQVTITLPDRRGRKEILELYVKKL